MSDQKIKINVTQEDIDNGVKGSPRLCPVALACKRMWITEEHEFCVIYVSTGRITKEHRSMRGDVHQWYYQMPREATNFIYAFDDGYYIDDYGTKIPIEVKPFEFEAELIEESGSD